MLIGHAKIWKYFKQAIENGNLGHVYCLVGAPQVGKRKLAKLIAAKLLNIEEEKLNTSPDYYYVERENDEKSGKLKNEITVAQARGLKARMGNKAWGGGCQVTIIDEVEKLNAEAGNALLKTLEEPPAKSLFFLLTEDDSKLLPTIKSRAQTFYLPLISEEEITRGLRELKFSRAEAEEAAKMAWGRPGKAIALARSEELRKDEEARKNIFEHIIGQPFYVKAKEAEKLAGKDDTEDVKAKVADWLDAAMVEYRKKLLDQNNSAAGAAQIGAAVNSLQKAKEKLATNVNLRLLLENTIINF